MKNIILDTDIGTDVDDAIALALCLKSKNLDLKAITTSAYDSKKRAMIAKKLTKIFGKEIPVAYGFNYGDKLSVGFEGNGLLTEKDNFELDDVPSSLISSTARKYKDIDLICIGPLGNIAEAIELGAKVNHIYFMGGAEKTVAVGRMGGMFVPSYFSHNVNISPYSAEVVFDSNIPMTIITKEVAKKVYLDKNDLENIKKLNTPWSDYIYQNAMDWLKVVKRDVCYMYDPLTVAAAEDKSIIKTKELGNIEVSLDVDIKRFKQYLFNTLGV